MTVVAIVGVLAVLAYEGYSRWIISSHQTEANQVLSGIKQRQEAYKAETGQYMNLSRTLAFNQNHPFESIYPHCVNGLTAPGDFKVAWPAGSTACPTSCCQPGTDWVKLRVQTDAPTFYGFTTIAGTSGTPAGAVSGMTINGGTPNWPASTSLNPWFVATAVADTNSNGVFTTVMISSFDNEVYVDNENE
jgi:type II secretory pathway pseudopilin PulG